MTSTARTVRTDAIRDAAAHIYDLVVRTPLLRLQVPNEWRRRWPRAPDELYLKLETFQPIGSFKIRGAHNAVRLLPPDARAHGVWTISAGNAAQGVALAARAAGIPCAILLSDKAPIVKREAIARLGATIVPAPFERCWEAIETHEDPAMRGRLVHPFDDDDFVAGNATLGLEVLEQLPGVRAIVASMGGGGLLGGIAAAVRDRADAIAVHGAEPETASPLAASFAQGGPVRFDNWRASFVDGAGGRSVLATMWPLLCGGPGTRGVRDAIVVTLDDIRAAMRVVAEQAHIICEGAGAMAVAAALTGQAGPGPVVAVVSGGNIDLSRFAALVDGVTPDLTPALD